MHALGPRIALFLAAIALAACSAEVVCGPGTVLVGGECRPALRCGAGLVEVNGQCTVPREVATCQPSCAPGQECGGDGCGGSCGTCTDAARKFCVGGLCAAECTPSCDGRACGDDGCGGSCGACAGEGETCSALGHCVPPAWHCAASDYADGRTCDCDCGAPDPDCEDPKHPVAGCASPTATCNAAGRCEGGQTGAVWACAPATYADGHTCHCGCGIPDPDCADASHPIVGCATGEACVEGLCAACEPACDNRECGDDGCGGTCGSCADPDHSWCTAAGQCATCTPACDNRACGDDGCGGSCGSCGSSEYCQVGRCVPLPVDASCANHCGDVAPAGCSCRGDCARLGTCCADVGDACGCQPDCGTAECGDDGCGGTCGACGAGASCVNHTCVDDPCSPDPCSGHGACVASGSTATCTCGPGYAGGACERCAPGFVGYPDCHVDLCTPNPCSAKGTCNAADGSCTCQPGFRGAACTVCFDGHGTYPNCSVPRCGDGILDRGEACDDHNGASGDGCSPTCAIEPGFRCVNAVNVNTGSDNAGHRSAVGTSDLVWSWSEGLGGARQQATVAGNCPNDPNLWTFAAPYAEWINRYGCDVNSPFDHTTYYHATFTIPTTEAAAATVIQGTVWADNRIADVLVNGVSTGLSSSGNVGYNGPGISFGAWPSSLYRQGTNTITVAVYNAGASPNPDGLLVQVPNAFGAGSVCTHN